MGVAGDLSEELLGEGEGRGAGVKGGVRWFSGGGGREGFCFRGI